MSDAAELDIRLPIGALFVLLGALLAAYGWLAARGVVRVDLWWGVAMLAFGVVLLVGARMADRRKTEERA